MFSKITAVLVLGQALAAPTGLEPRQSCPDIHVFGARETTASAGYGSAGTVVNLVLNAHSGSTAEAIDYPAEGGTDSAYAASVQAGVAAVGNQVNSFNSKCPDAQLVLVGYSQGGQIEDDALCGGGDTNDGVTSTTATISSAAQAQVKAVIWMGNPRHSPGEPFNVGTATAGGFDARPSGFSCGSFSSKIQSYCDAADPYCSNGDDTATHQGYGSEYGQAALTFVNSKLS